MYRTIISSETLKSNLTDPRWKVFDCRFYLADPDRAEAEYKTAHIPGAIYAHLEQDLSAPVQPGITGRHPLPEISALTAFLGRSGIEPGSQVVAYDAQGGALAAARAWWLLRWLGLEAVAVLDGGWQKWLREGLPVRGGSETSSPSTFVARPRHEMLVDSDQVEALIHVDNIRLLDSRSADRFRGENETIDPVAGHIPGAISVPYAGNLKEDGTFHSPEALKERFEAVLGGSPASQAVLYCGSGVTASLNVLAMEIAGLGTSRLYPGSWSEWITGSSRPISRSSS